ncbi:hypothetical protein C1T31_03455 [Hanstruepera neustonica]|uniref:Uncharacterized protein n=2 Tax=Hanstruepera neustonica TaxID=1445657 RepID=A0A2K1E4J2_9FLAO|nr:hypothetical protein C1T31_03455 [Hanstruepera neustonica]
MNNNGFIMLKRDIMEWEWYQDLNTYKVFMHCLIKVNYSPKKWQGILIDKGEFITSHGSLAHETGLTVSMVRTSLKKLENTGYISITTANYTKIRVLNLNEFVSESNQNQVDRVENHSNTASLLQKSVDDKEMLADQSQAIDKTLADQSHTVDRPLATTNTNNNTIKRRKKIFRENVFAHTNYNSKILKSFHDYWSELDPNGTKMRFESQRFFEIEKRLEKWINNERNYNHDKKEKPRLIKNRYPKSYEIK